MKQFFKMMFASMLGFFLACVLVSLIFIGIVASALSFTKKQEVVVPDKTILQLTLEEPFHDRSSDDPMSYINFNNLSAGKPMGLTEILETLKNASSDEKVSGMLLDLSEIPVSIATIEEIRNALIDFKKSGKFIVSYSENYNQKAYYLASVADKIYLNPAGSMEFKGLTGQVMFFKGLLEKLDVEPQVIRHGKFKSAVEPFILDKMSEPSKEQTLSYVSAIWNHMLDQISKARKISTTELVAIADNHRIGKPEDAVDNSLVDKLMYKDQLLDELKNRVGSKTVKDMSIMKLAKYQDAPKSEKHEAGKDRIAVIYAEGNIISGQGDDQSIGSERISKAIRKARTDEKIKAIVLRVNSPGGSALASDVIWREMSLAKKVKPVVVSMGDLAASGGYYISCAANKIFASPNTLTGSIGVFGIVPNMQKFFNNNLGITFDEVKTNPYSDYIPTMRPMTEAEKNFLTADIENIYSTFLNHVSEGRKMPVASVDSIGQGRVWSGVDAKRIGLIDEFGGLQAAVDEAAKLAKVEKYRIVKLPEQKDAMTQIIEALSGDQSAKVLKKEMGAVYPYLKYLQTMSRMEGVQALMPFEITIR